MTKMERFRSFIRNTFTAIASLLAFVIVAPLWGSIVEWLGWKGLEITGFAVGAGASWGAFVIAEITRRILIMLSLIDNDDDKFAALTKVMREDIESRAREREKEREEREREREERAEEREERERDRAERREEFARMAEMSEAIAKSLLRDREADKKTIQDLRRQLAEARGETNAQTPDEYGCA